MVDSNRVCGIIGIIYGGYRLDSIDKKTYNNIDFTSSFLTIKPHIRGAS